MKIKRLEPPKLHYDESLLTIVFEKGQGQDVARLFADTNIDPKKDYEVIIKPKKKMRSLDANRYMWALLGELAKLHRTSDRELYRNYVRVYGPYNAMLIANAAVKRFMTAWEDRGIGWVCEVERESKHQGYMVVRAYYGSSTYDTAEMSRLLDQIVIDCQAEGIDTMTPDELARLKSLWGGEIG